MVIGFCLTPALVLTSHLKIAGGTIQAIKTTENIPIIVTSASE